MIPDYQPTEHEKAIIRALEGRIALLDKVLSGDTSDETRTWLDGKRCGYEQCLELLRTSLESILVEL